MTVEGDTVVVDASTLSGQIRAIHDKGTGKTSPKLDVNKNETPKSSGTPENLVIPKSPEILGSPKSPETPDDMVKVEAPTFNTERDMKSSMASFIQSEPEEVKGTKKESVLVCVLAQTRAHEITWKSFKKHVLETLGADLAVCCGQPTGEDPFVTNAKYKWFYPEVKDWGVGFSEADEKENFGKKYLFGTNAIHARIKGPKTSNDNIQYLGEFSTLEELKKKTASSAFKEYQDIVYHEPTFPKADWKCQAYGIKVRYPTNVKEAHVTTIKNDLFDWRNFASIGDQWLGGVTEVGHHSPHPGSAGILIFFRWFLLQQLETLNKYDRIIVTRSDYLYQAPHPSMSILDPNHIWIPSGEGYGGYTDRHAVVPKKHYSDYLGILTRMVTDGPKFLDEIKHRKDWNLERILKHHLTKAGCRVMGFNFVMHCVRGKDDKTRWVQGIWDPEKGYFIKYPKEKEQAEGTIKLKPLEKSFDEHYTTFLCAL